MLLQLVPVATYAQETTAEAFSVDFSANEFNLQIGAHDINFKLRTGDFAQEIEQTPYGTNETISYNSGNIVYEIQAGDLDLHVEDGALAFYDNNTQLFTRPIATMRDAEGGILGSAQYQIIDKITRTTQNFNAEEAPENRDGYKEGPDGYWYKDGVAFEYKGGTYLRVKADWNQASSVEGEVFGERDFTEFLTEETSESEETTPTETETPEQEITEANSPEQNEPETASESEKQLAPETSEEQETEEQAETEEETQAEEVKAPEVSKEAEVEDTNPETEQVEENSAEEASVETPEQEETTEENSEEEITEEEQTEEEQAEPETQIVTEDVTAWLFAIPSAYAQEQIAEENIEQEIVEFEEKTSVSELENAPENTEETSEEKSPEQTEPEVTEQEQVSETEEPEIATPEVEIQEQTEENSEEETTEENTEPASEITPENSEQEVETPEQAEQETTPTEENILENIEQEIINFEQETTTVTYVIKLDLQGQQPAEIILPTVVLEDQFMQTEKENLVCANPALYAEMFTAINAQTNEEQYLGLDFTADSIRDGEAVIKTSERELTLPVEEVSAGGDLLAKAKQNLENKKSEVQNESDHFLVDALGEQVMTSTKVAEKLEESVAGYSEKMTADTFVTNANGRTLETKFNKNSNTVEKEITVNNSYSFDMKLQGLESYCQSVYAGANGDTKVYSGENELITYTQSANTGDASLKEWIYALAPNNGTNSLYTWDLTLTSGNGWLEFTKQADGSVMLYYVVHSADGDTLTALGQLDPLVYFTAQGSEKQANYIINGSTLSISVNEPTESYPLLIDPTFTLVNGATGFSGRSNHASMVYGGKMWVMGGYDGGNDLNDVWSSVDGNTWVRATAAAPWTIRSFATPFVFNGKMWIVGGDYRSGGSTIYTSDVWSSVDGINWTQETANAAFGQRSGQTGTVFNGKMWIIGGRNGAGTYLSDVWSSADGVNWIQETGNAGFGGRTAHEVAVFNNELWVVGGWTGSTQYTDVWHSADGVNWVQATASMALGGRDSHTLISYDNKLWLLGGYNGSFKNDVWSSADGATWVQENFLTDFTPRDNHQSVIFDNKIWVIAGKDGSRLTDAWSSALDETAPTISDISANSATAPYGSTVRFYVNAADTGGSGLNTTNAEFYLRTVGAGAWDRVNGAIMSWDAANSRYYYDIVLNDTYNTGYRAMAIVYDNIGYSVTRDESPTEFVISNTPAPVSNGTAPADNGSVNGNGGNVNFTTTAVVDADGQAVEYLFRVATGNDAETGVVCDSGWQAGVNYSCNPGVGGTYYWHVYTRDTVETTNPGYVYDFVNNYQPIITDNQAGDDTVRNAAGTTYDVDFADATLGIDIIQYSLGTASGLTDIATWQDIWTGDGASYTTDWQVDTSLLAQGRNYVNVRATDLGGLTTTLNAPFYIEWDSVAPPAPVVSSSTPTNDTTPTWTWVSGGADGNGNYRYKLDDADLTSGATTTALLTYTSGVLAEGTHTLYVQERDNVGNWSPSGSYAVVVDTTSPDVVLTYSANPAPAGAMTITATFTEALAGTPQIAINQQGTTDIAATNMTATADPLIWTYSYTVVTATGGTYVDGLAAVVISNASDPAGNALGNTTNQIFTIDTTAPTINSAYPSNGALLPISPEAIRINYSDNAVNTGSIAVRIDLTGDLDYDDPSEDLTASCTTLNTTDVVCPIGSTLLPGSHQMYFTVTDTAGNTTTLEYSFWVDNFTFKAENLNVDLGTLSPGIGSTTANDTEHTKITITTYGAGVDVQALVNGQLTNGTDNVAWHANNVAVAGTGEAYRVKETAAGAFGNYFNFNDQPTVTSKAKLADGTYGALLTYTFYVEHYARSGGNESPGTYNQTVSFNANLTY